MTLERNMKPNVFYRLSKDYPQFMDQFCREYEFIYRYMPLERFLETIQKNQMVFASPRLWQDPFDNILFKQKVQNPNSVINKVYACCFTLNPHSDAYWKTYSNGGHCVRLKIKSRPFFSTLAIRNENISFGRLRYLRESKLVKEIHEMKGLRESLEKEELDYNFLWAFHLKRLPFKYENELRVVIQGSANEEKIKHIEINCLETIDQIYLDPRMGKYETIALKEYLKQFKIPVKKSQLLKERLIEIK
jgi:hypothetical protein